MSKMTPQQRQMLDQAQGMLDRRLARLVALSATLTKTDRILTGRRDLAVKFRAQGAEFRGDMSSTPAYTDGKTIAINDQLIPDIRTKSGLVTTMGLNYHELAHNLYTPPTGSALVSRIRMGGYFSTFNVLEDSRIESLLVAKYRSAGKFLVQPVLEFIIKNEDTWATAHLYVHGRKFVPKEVRKELRDVFQGTAAVRSQCEAIIDEYRKMDLSSVATHDRAYELVVQLHGLIDQLRGDLAPDEQSALDKHGGCGGVGTNSGGGGFNNVLISEETKDASRRRDEQDAAEEEEGGEDESTEDGTEEQPEGDSGDSTDDQEDEDDIQRDDDDGEEGDHGRDDDEDDIDSEDADGLDGDEQEDEDDSIEGSSAGGPSGGSEGDLGDDGEASGDDSSGDALGDLDGDGGSAAGSASGSLEAVAAALEEAMQELEEDSEVENEVSRLRDAMDDDSLMDSVLTQIPYLDEPVDDQTSRSASMVIREFQKLATQFEAGWNYGSDYGRLNTQRAMTAEWGDTDIFDHWEEGREMDAAVEAFIALDRSSSMGGGYSNGHKSLINPACKALWVIKRALDEIDGVSTVCTFDSDTHKLYDRGEKANPSMVRRVSASGGTRPMQVIDEGRRILNLSERPNKMFVVITDGAWGSYTDIQNSLTAVKGTRVFIGIEQTCPDEYREAFDVIANISEPGDIAKVIEQAVESMLNEAIKRR